MFVFLFLSFADQKSNIVVTAGQSFRMGSLEICYYSFLTQHTTEPFGIAGIFRELPLQQDISFNIKLKVEPKLYINNQKMISYP